MMINMSLKPNVMIVDGGPGYSTMIPALQMYKIAFGDGKFGYASALGVVLFIVIILLTLASRKLLGEEE